MSQAHVLNGNEVAIDRATPKERTSLLPGRLRWGPAGAVVCYAMLQRARRALLSGSRESKRESWPAAGRGPARLIWEVVAWQV